MISLACVFQAQMSVSKKRELSDYGLEMCLGCKVQVVRASARRSPSDEHFALL